MPEDFNNDKTRRPGFIRRLTRDLTQTEVPLYKSDEFEHKKKKDDGYDIPSVNSTISIINALKRDPNQKPYQTFAEKSQVIPKYTVWISMGQKIEGTDYPTMILMGGMSFNKGEKNERILINTVEGILNGEPVEKVREETIDSLVEYTQEFKEARYDQEGSLKQAQEAQKKDSTQESEPKSIF